MSPAVPPVRPISSESRSSGLERKLGGKFHLKLNMGSKPIANKYHEGKMKRTLKRELKVPEIAEREANGTSVAWQDCRVHDAPDRLLPCVSTPVRDRGKLQGHGSSSSGE